MSNVANSSARGNGNPATDHTYLALGSVFRVTSSDRDLGDLLDRIFAPFRSEQADVRADVVLHVEERPGHPDHFDITGSFRANEPERLFEDTHRDRVVMEMIVQLNSGAIRLADLHTVHAGVVSLGGQAIAFPASSGAGKSTLVAACVQRGFEYVSDEALCLDWDTGAVEPYPKPLWLSSWSRDVLGIADTQLTFLSSRYEEAIVIPGDLGWPVAQPPLRLAHLVSFDLGDQPPTLEPLPRGYIASELVRHAFAKGPSERIFRLAASRARDCEAWNLRVGDPNQAAELLYAKLGGRAFDHTGRSASKVRSD